MPSTVTLTSSPITSDSPARRVRISIFLSPSRALPPARTEPYLVPPMSHARLMAHPADRYRSCCPRLVELLFRLWRKFTIHFFGLLFQLKLIVQRTHGQ